jgi:putative membrane protein
MMWDDHGGGWGWGSYLLMTITMLAIFGLVGWGLFLAFGNARRSVTPTGQAGPTPTAEAILAERLARGEIDPKEYRERLDALHGEKPT